MSWLLVVSFIFLLGSVMLAWRLLLFQKGEVLKRVAVASFLVAVLTGLWGVEGLGAQLGDAILWAEFFLFPLIGIFLFVLVLSQEY